jgi:hypothetical protein
MNPNANTLAADRRNMGDSFGVVSCIVTSLSACRGDHCTPAVRPVTSHPDDVPTSPIDRPRPVQAVGWTVHAGNGERAYFGSGPWK